MLNVSRVPSVALHRHAHRLVVSQQVGVDHVVLLLGGHLLVLLLSLLLLATLLLLDEIVQVVLQLIERVDGIVDKLGRRVALNGRRAVRGGRGRVRVGARAGRELVVQAARVVVIRRRCRGARPGSGRAGLGRVRVGRGGQHDVDDVRRLQILSQTFPQRPVIVQQLARVDESDGLAALRKPSQ